MDSPIAPRYHAVVFDLFGTLIDAPTVEERGESAAEIAALVGATANDVEAVLIDSWIERHNGRLPTATALAAYVADRCGGAHAGVDALCALLLQQAKRRLQADDTVLGVLRHLRTHHLRVGVLSDASADIADAWTSGALAGTVDSAVFSCHAGAVKPHPNLYRRVLDGLRTLPGKVLYCGDGGGDELRGATAMGFDAVRVARRGSLDGLAFGEHDWTGPSVGSAEDVPALAIPRKT